MFAINERERERGREAWPHHVDAHIKWHNYEATTWGKKHLERCLATGAQHVVA